MTNSTETHRAPIGAIVACITGKLVCDLDDLYALQDFLAGRPLMTHERTVAFGRQEAALIAQFPQLAEVEAPPFPKGAGAEAACRAWVARVAAHVGWYEADVRWVPGCEVDAGEAFDRVLAGMARRRA